MRRSSLAPILLLCTPVLAQENLPPPLATEASGMIPVRDERQLVVQGIVGSVSIKLGKPGEIRYLSTKPGESGRNKGKEGELPLAVHAVAGTFTLRPVPGEAPGTPHDLQISVPPEIYARVEMSGGGKLYAVSLRGGLEVTGKTLVVDARALEGNAEIDVEGGTIVVSGTKGSVRVRGRGLNVTVQSAEGLIGGDLVSGFLKVVRADQGIDVDLEDTPLELDGAKGPVRVRASGGTVQVRNAEAGGEYDLTSAPIALEKCKGDITVTSDANVSYKDLEADLHFDVYSGSVKGSGNKGLIEARTRNASVTIEANEGPVRVQGDGLEVRLSNIGGETLVYATTSNVAVDNVGGKLTVESDRGDVVISRATSDVYVNAEGGGTVTLVDLTGPATVEADVDAVEASWASIPQKDSRIANEDGDVTVRFPATGGGCRVEATSKGGRIETDLPRVRVSDDGSSAEGIVGNAQRPTITVEAGRDVHLLSGGAPAAPSDRRRRGEPEE